MNKPVALINMPFGNLLTPSIGLGLLKAGLERNGISTRVFNFQFRFAELIGHDDYTLIYGKTHTEQLAGEFIFSQSLFGPRRAVDVNKYVRDVLEAEDPSSHTRYSDVRVEKLKDTIAAARAKVDGFLDECLEQVLELHPKVVGFTSLFHQHAASLALARLIKNRSPQTFIILGGANCEGTMGEETLRQFEFVDAIVSGEGDLVFPQIVATVLDAMPVPQIAGVFSRNRSALRVMQQRPRNTAMIENLDALPVPDYDEYFKELKTSSLSFTKDPSLLFETSRGCWWGEKQHCTFCGLNGETMKYRSKSATRAMEEFQYLTEKYPGCSVNVVDNILDMDYFKDFIPMLAERNHGFKLFYEVKANLKKEQLQLLCAAGVREIQPGIESFSDNVLHIMRKGVSTLQNIQLLKWSKELGINLFYNLIWGFPGETAKDYEEMIQLLPLITHLQPPIGDGAIRIDRFSPNFEKATELGFKNLRPHPAYAYIYPFESDVLSNLAYFFVAEGNRPAHAAQLDSFATEIRKWRRSHHKSELFSVNENERLLIWDFRPAASEVLTVLKGAEKFVYISCDQARTPQQIAEMSRHSKPQLAPAEVTELLDSFTDRGLVVHRGNTYLALAVQKRAASNVGLKRKSIV